mmetsp:Transcript_96073/g.266931  ORF Transcript_96073/g.266931 Transcript_96073/m.266931 type:complete len:223 (-) Transcript_96073:171-839(-)
MGVVVEDLRENLRDAPVTVSLDLCELLLVEVPQQLSVQAVNGATTSVRKGHDDQRQQDIVEPLHVAAGRLPYRPNKKHTLHQRLDPGVLHHQLRWAEAARTEPRPGQVLSDLPQEGTLTVALAITWPDAVNAIEDCVRRVVEAPPQIAVLLAFALQGLYSSLARQWPVAEEQLPDLATAQPLRYPRPCELRQGVLVHGFPCKSSIEACSPPGAHGRCGGALA